MQKAHDKQIYLDYASTTPTNPEILKDAQLIMNDYFQNADSLHFGGQRVSDLVRQSRKTLGEMLGVLPYEIIFTSGASESNSAAIKGIAFANMHKGKHIITTAVEHSSVTGAMKQLRERFGFEIDVVGVDYYGNIDLSELKSKLRNDTILVCAMAINNEVGAITNVSALAQIVKKNSNAYIHIDGVQALAHHEFSMQQIDSVSFSAHKIHGLKGSGLWVKRAHVECDPLINGGQQQFGYRGGTLDNVNAILWAKTLRLARENYKKNQARIEALSKRLYDIFGNIDNVILNSSPQGSPYIFNVSILGVGSEIMMNGLNKAGIAVSAQSTCNSASLEPSHVLKAMGRSDEAALSTVRISMSYLTTEEEIEKVIKEILEIKKYVNHKL